MTVDLQADHRFGMLSIQAFAGSRHMWGTSLRVWECKCDCGAIIDVAQKQLTRGKTKSCGCMKKQIGRLNRTHGESGRRSGITTPEYNAWMLMRRRCNSQGTAEYENYGGRGIVVCERWNSYEAFLLDVGRRPSPHHSLDRFPNNDGNYEPGNVRWATRQEQAANKRNSKLIPYQGQNLLAAEWGRRVGIPGIAISRRLRAGWSVERALSQPFVGSK